MEQMPRRILPYRCWNKIANLGDAITPYILERLFAVEPVHGSKHRPHLLSIGSIFDLATPQSIIWGSGIMDPRKSYDHIAPDRIRAVRGHKTRDKLVRDGAKLADVPLGDPGIFVADLLDRIGGADTGEARFRVAIIPHHSSIEHALFDSVRHSPEVRIVNMRDSSLRPLQLIQQAEVVVAESLHGLIFAEALSRPSVWITTKKDSEWNFKFDDWFSTTLNPQTAPLRANEIARSGWDHLFAKAERRPLTIDREALLAAFPMDLVTAGKSSLVKFEDCRACSPLIVAVDGGTHLDGSLGMLVRSPDEFRTLFADNLETIKSAVAAAFRHWAERGHHIVTLGADRNAFDGVRHEISDVLNRFSEFDCMFVHPKSALAATDSTDVVAMGNLWVSRQAVLSKVLAIRATKDISDPKRIGTIFA